MQVQGPNSLHGFACGDFLLKSQDNHFVAGRSMEFPIPMESNVLVYNRGEKFQSTAPGGGLGHSWTSKLGYVGIDAFHMNRVDEGLNEAGLSFGALTLNGTQYQFIGEAQRPEALAMMDVGAWVLGNFATVDEVKEALGNVRVWGQMIKELGCIPGLHIALHDATGKTAVIEFLDGKAIFRDNPKGVLTNEPPLPEQLLNLERYSHLTPFPNGPVADGGMVGLPGDWSSESRFVRIAKEVEFINANPPTTYEGAIERATHILNTVDVPKGLEIVELANENMPITTRWSTVKDLTSRVFYYRAHNDGRLQAVDLTKETLEPGTVHSKIAVCGPHLIFDDVTGKLEAPQAAPAPGLLERFWSYWGSATPQEKEEMLTQSKIAPSANTTTEQVAIPNTAIAAAAEEASTEPPAAPQTVELTSAPVPGLLERFWNMWGSSTPQQQEAMLTQSHRFADVDTTAAEVAANAALAQEANAEEPVAPMAVQQALPQAVQEDASQLEVTAAPVPGLLERFWNYWGSATSEEQVDMLTQSKMFAKAETTTNKVVAIGSALTESAKTDSGENQEEGLNSQAV